MFLSSQLSVFFNKYSHCFAHQYALNKAMAEWEVLNVSTKKSNLANPVRGRPDINCTGNAECWAHRRHARRVYEISQTFQKVFGAGSINKRIRPVYASWTIQLQVSL